MQYEKCKLLQINGDNVETIARYIKYLTPNYSNCAQSYDLTLDNRLVLDFFVPI